MQESVKKVCWRRERSLSSCASVAVGGSEFLSGPAQPASKISPKDMKTVNPTDVIMTYPAWNSLIYSERDAPVGYCSGQKQ